MSQKLGGTKPILCAAIMREVDGHLIELLTSLRSTEGELPTIAPGWSVRDVAAHLLDTALRKLSGARDRCRTERVEIRSHQDVITLVNRLNREGVTHVVIPQAIAWRMFTKGMDRETAYPQLTVRGDETLAGHVLRLVAIVG